VRRQSCAGGEMDRVIDPLVIEPSRMTFSIVNTHADMVRVAICGCLDTTMIGVFRRELTNLLRSRPAFVDIDMSRLRFIDNAGVGLLLSFFEDLFRQRGRAIVHGLHMQPLDSLKAIMPEAVRATSGPVN
jgi:anti-anti-sigma regulatory factor